MSFQPTEIDGAARHREERRPERGEDVLAVVPVALDVAAVGAERVAERGGAVDREDVAAGRELGRDRGCRPDELGRGAARDRRARLAGSIRAGSPGVPAGLVGVGFAVVVGALAAAAAFAVAETAPTSIVLPAGSPPWSAISFTRIAVTLAVAERGGFCELSTEEPSTSSDAPVGERDDEVRRRRDQLAEHGEARDRRGGDTPRGAHRSGGDARTDVERLDRDLAAEERDGQRADAGLRARRDAGLGDDTVRRPSRPGRSSRPRDRRSPG